MVGVVFFTQSALVERPSQEMAPHTPPELLNFSPCFVDSTLMSPGLFVASKQAKLFCRVLSCKCSSRGLQPREVVARVAGWEGAKFTL